MLIEQRPIFAEEPPVKKDEGMYTPLRTRKDLQTVPLTPQQEKIIEKVTGKPVPPRK